MMHGQKNINFYMSRMQGGIENSTLHTTESSTQNNKYQVSHKHSCFSDEGPIFARNM